jgi:ferredoxin-NADP reductase
MHHDTPTAPASVASLSDIRVAKLVAEQAFACSRWLRFELTDQRPLHFHGGQYVIVETGLTLPNGKPRRRAYSLLSDDRVHTHFELAVFQLAGGAGCASMCRLSLDSELHFSAPWGKLRAPQADARGPVWVIATDSGMSAALGLIRGRDFEPHLERTTVHGWTTSAQYFLEPAFIRARVSTRARLELGTLAPIGAEQRSDAVSARIQQLLAADEPEQVYLLGDGQVTRALQRLLCEHGVDPARIQVETFFNHVERVEGKPSPAPVSASQARCVLGVGCDRDIPVELFERGVLRTLSAHGLLPANLHCVASIDRKQAEPAILAFAEKYRLPMRFYSAATLDALSGVPNPSQLVARSVGTRAVSEPAALLASGATSLLVPKTRYSEPGASRSMTLALALVARPAGDGAAS